MKIKITDAKKSDIEKWVKKAAAQTIRDIEKFGKENNLERKKVALSFLDTLDEVAKWEHAKLAQAKRMLRPITRKKTKVVAKRRSRA